MATDHELESNRAWLGLVQPSGLVVSAAALAEAGVFPDRAAAIEKQQALAEVCEARPRTAMAITPTPCLAHFPAFATRVLEWAPADLAPADAFDVVLQEEGETLRADWAVRDGETPLLLVKQLALGQALDEVAAEDGALWHASPQQKFERLLRANGVHAGLLVNGFDLRLVYKPDIEAVGHLTFPVGALLEVAGRPLLSAVVMLLGANRLFIAPNGQRLLELLAASRKYQSTVSTKLAGQVLGALWELMRGFQAAWSNEGAKGGRRASDPEQQAPGAAARMNGDPARHAGAARPNGDPTRHAVALDDADDVYGGLLTALLRLVFLLYAEDRGLMPDDELYVNSYSVTGLYERLRDDAGRWPDTMDQRYGAWAWLLSLFRLVHDGGGHGRMRLPARHGQLFDPAAYAFLEGRNPSGTGGLEGRNLSGAAGLEGRDAIPRVSDGCIFRVLDALLLLDGERLSYGALDVEQLGSVYEAMMGFSVERAEGFSIGVRSEGQKAGSVRADAVIDVEALLAEKPANRKKWLQEHAGADVGGKSLTDLQAATTPDEVVAALGRKVSRYTPALIAPGSLYLQPGEERRRSGSHYTPRELTKPIVETTLRPILDDLGKRPTPEQILDLKICDPAMGSGAFLVEACRQLAEHLVAAWDAHDATPEIPLDEEPLLHARRLVAQRCLYGVDKNPFAVNLAKLSLWLVTLARDHAFTFLNHALKCGDSLVGLTREQIERFTWKSESADSTDDALPPFKGCKAWVDVARHDRSKLAALDDERESEKVALLAQADKAVDDLKLAGDLVIAAFFEGKTEKEREGHRLVLRAKVDEWRHKGMGRAQLEDEARALRAGARGVKPFHWALEFPEVFSRGNPGFDAVVGNPPFAGKNTLIAGNREGYVEWLKTVHEGSHGAADLVAHFFRRAFTRLRKEGAFGLIATNTIAQGDTRESGLRWICTNGGTIYCARKRVMWPGVAAVVVSVVHVRSAAWTGPRSLNGNDTTLITAFLFHKGGHESPTGLASNAERSFQGSIVLGMGFTFDDTDTKGVASSLSEMREAVQKDPRNAERIFPYIGGEEVNNSPTHSHHRYVINFGEMSKEEAWQWPDLMQIVEMKVKPERMAQNREIRKRYWWRFGETTPSLYRTVRSLERVLANSRVSQHLAFTFLPSGLVYADRLYVFPLPTDSAFGALQSRPHEIWARFFSSTLEDRLNYSASDCFETFPFPENWTTDPALEAVGKTYYAFRADLMVRNNEGLTDTYNRFHDPDEKSPDIHRLRELHAAMDRAVLDAYGWQDIPTDCEFLLDYEIDEETWGTKKKPYRYRWPDEVHDEVLARLLDLNQKRAEQERLSGAAASAKTSKAAKAKGTPRPRAPKATTQQETLFPD